MFPDEGEIDHRPYYKEVQRLFIDEGSQYRLRFAKPYITGAAVIDNEIVNGASLKRNPERRPYCD